MFGNKAKLAGAGIGGGTIGAILTFLVARGVLPPELADPEVVAAVTVLFTTGGSMAATYWFPPNQSPPEAVLEAAPEAVLTRVRKGM